MYNLSNTKNMISLLIEIITNLYNTYYYGNTRLQAQQKEGTVN